MSAKVEEILWAEKYRPRTLDDIVNQREMIDRLKKFVKEKNMPHYFLQGHQVPGRLPLL